MSKAKKLALAGIFTALSVVVLFIGSVFQTLDLSAAAAGSIIILIAFIELGKRLAFGVYIAAAVLSLLLLPYKSAALVFALFTGFYPILKEPLNRIQPAWLSYAVRILCFNALLTALIFISTKLLNIEENYLGFGVIIYVLANVTFIVFDFAIERIAATYSTRIRPKIFGRR